MPSFLYIPSAAGSWVPTDLTTLKLWLDAADGNTVYDATSGGSLVTAHDAQVKRWEDKSGNGFHATQNNANGPKRQTTSGTLNSLPVMKFVGATDSFLTIADNSAFRTYPLTVVSVIRTSQTALNKGVVGKWAGAGNRDWLLWHNATPSAVPGAALRNSADTANFAANGASNIHNGAGRIFGGTFDPPSGNVQVWVDGTSAASTSATSSNGSSTNAVTVGSYASNNAGVELTGDIAELVIANTISTSDREKIEGYLAHRWGLTSGLPSGHPYKNSAP